MNLLPHEEKIALLKAPQLYLTNQRVIRDGYVYGSINLRDITMIQTVSHSNPAIIALGFVTMAICTAFGEMVMYAGIAAFVVSILYFVSQRFSTLDIHAPGNGSLTVRVNYVDKKTIREFIYKIEKEMERVKNEPRNFKADALPEMEVAE